LLWQNNTCQRHSNREKSRWLTGDGIIRAVAGVRKQRSKQHKHEGGVAILHQNAANLKIKQIHITDGQIGPRTMLYLSIRSPLTASQILITCLYVSPSEGEVQVEEFFHTLTQQDHYPAHEMAQFFIAHVAEELEHHITLEERATILFRVGDCYWQHTLPTWSAAAAITIARISSQQRGRLLLWTLNTMSFLILNWRFETIDGPIPDTLQLQDEATINDYNLIAKQYFSRVKSETMLCDPITLTNNQLKTRPTHRPQPNSL